MAALPQNWDEITFKYPRYLKSALKLLKETFPKRYRHLTESKALDKLNYAPQTSKKDTVACLKAFRRIIPPDTTEPNPPAVVDIAAFFFVRLVAAAGPEAYCMTVGVDGNKVSAIDLSKDLLDVCRVMRGYAPNYMTLEIVNEVDLEIPKGGPPADLDDTKPHAVTVGQAFTKSFHRLTRQTQLPSKSCPWPSDLFRWTIDDLT